MCVNVTKMTKNTKNGNKSNKLNYSVELGDSSKKHFDFFFNHKTLFYKAP